jgi:membrane-bound metal-dependent hydrolase YbcI (DUF457 family)
MGIMAGAVVCTSAGADSVMLIAGAGAAGIGSLIPDIDHHNSIVSRRVILPVHWLFKHRGITHSPLIPLALAVSAMAWMIQPLILLAFAAGYAAHLCGDGITKSGIYLSPRHRIHLTPKKLRITTGGAAEWLVLVLCTLLAIPALWSAGVQLWSDTGLLALLLVETAQQTATNIVREIKQ